MTISIAATDTPGTMSMQALCVSCRDTGPSVHPEWQLTFSGTLGDVCKDRAAALEQQINDAIAVLADRGLITK